ncbi:hypothetical protein [Elizabethkingia anophelis]|uniref:hypothetical protein n=1 Tax=Elizabethkingia anophelis TaxID=1117645 RepID=UPI0038925EEB
MSQNIKNTLLEARKAYRFLYDYQKRVLDLIDYIGGKYGFRYRGGYSKFSDPAPRNGKGSLGNWAWDWLNLYFYEFNFESKETNKGIIHFAILILNDSGYFDARNEKDANKLNTSSFKSVEESESKLIFVVGKNMWSGWGMYWDEPEFLSQTDGNKKEDENKLMLFKHYPLENFENEEKAMSCIKDFEEYCADHNIDFKINLNPFE